MRVHVFAATVLVATALGAALHGPASIDWPAAGHTLSASVAAPSPSGLRASRDGTDDIDWP
ncbi:hypothetical protein [Streptomyces sp. NPDC046985]|uniref:hypothetical protein n=1 Tax=Streptomyces sp. NPDC046985 TaxID=3155377 RepID=UPI0033ECD937